MSKSSVRSGSRAQTFNFINTPLHLLNRESTTFFKTISEPNSSHPHDIISSLKCLLFLHLTFYHPLVCQKIKKNITCLTFIDTSSSHLCDKKQIISMECLLFKNHLDWTGRGDLFRSEYFD